MFDKVLFILFLFNVHFVLSMNDEQNRCECEKKKIEQMALENISQFKIFSKVVGFLQFLQFFDCSLEEESVDDFYKDKDEKIFKAFLKRKRY
jgi:hypothetical protein